MIRSPVTRNLAVGIATAALMVATASMASAQNNGTVSGVIYDVDGQPVASELVEAHLDQREPHPLHEGFALGCQSERLAVARFGVGRDVPVHHPDAPSRARYARDGIREARPFVVAREIVTPVGRGE